MYCQCPAYPRPANVLTTRLLRGQAERKDRKVLQHCSFAYYVRDLWLLIRNKTADSPWQPRLSGLKLPSLN
jgi:hypothetical protein